jgi:hypothetical protein
MQTKIRQIVGKHFGKILLVGIFTLAFFALCLSLRNSILTQRGKLLSNENKNQAEFVVPAFEDMQSVIVLDAPSNEINQNFLKNRGGERPGFDNSVVNVTYDAFGGVSEMRSFPDNPRILMVVVETAPDGTKIARASSRTGELRQLPDNLVSRALSDGGDQIADALGFIAPVKPLEIIAPPETASLPAGVTETPMTISEESAAPTVKTEVQPATSSTPTTETSKRGEISSVPPNSAIPELKSN